jgi:gluconokinase
MTVLVLDIGSSSARALLFDDQARFVADALVQRKYAVTTTPPGAATLDAKELRSIVETCVDDILQHPAAKDIRVVGTATFVGNLLGVDKDGNPITPIYLYADTRSADDVAHFRSRSRDEIELIHQRTGCPLHTAYNPSRLRWLARTEPTNYARVGRWLDFATYLYAQWFETPSPCSHSVASWSGMLDRAGLRWDDEWLRFLNVPESALPPLADYSTKQHRLKSDYTGRWSQLSEIPFCLAVGDGAAANIGTGCCDTTRVAMSVGTTAALRMTIPTGFELHPLTASPVSGKAETSRASRDEVSPVPSVPSGLWCYRITEDLHLLGGATSEGGNLYRWARETLQLPPDFTDQLPLRRVDGHGLTALPLLAGERSPGWSLDATGSIAGLRLSTAPLDIAQATLEGLALRLALIYEQLGEYVDNDTEIIATGGALSPYLAQIIADALDHRLQVTAEIEITAQGVALLALRAIGENSPLGEPPEIAYVAEPRPEAVTALRAARKRQTDLYRKMIGDQGSPS